MALLENQRKLYLHCYSKFYMIVVQFKIYSVRSYISNIINYGWACFRCNDIVATTTLAIAYCISFIKNHIARWLRTQNDSAADIVMFSS